MRCFREWSIKRRLMMLTMGTTARNSAGIPVLIVAWSALCTFFLTLRLQRILCNRILNPAAIIDDKDRGFMSGANEYPTRPVRPERPAGIPKKSCVNGVPGKVPITEQDGPGRRIVRRLLHCCGGKAAEASNNRNCLERIARHALSLIRMDLKIPEMDGLEFISRPREQEQYRGTPIVVLTAVGLNTAMELSAVQ